MENAFRPMQEDKKYHIEVKRIDDKTIQVASYGPEIPLIGKLNYQGKMITVDEIKKKNKSLKRFYDICDERLSELEKEEDIKWQVVNLQKIETKMHNTFKSNYQN